MTRLYGYLEALLDPLTAAPVVRPPDRVGTFFSHFLAPHGVLLAVTLTAGLIAALAEFSLYVFIGVLVDWVNQTPPETFMAEHGWALAGMALIVLFVRPISVLASRGLTNLALVPGLTILVRWRAHRYVLRQSLTFFQNDFAGRIAQKVTQTGPALREAVVNVIDGIWFLVIQLAATIILFVAIDWRLMLPLLGWIAGYATVIVLMVPGVRGRSAALSEANSGLSGRIVDSYTNIQPVKLFAHAEFEDAFAREAFVRHLNAFRALMRAIVSMTVALTAINGVMILGTMAIAILVWTQGNMTAGAIAIAGGLVVRINQMSGWVLRTITSLFENIGTVENGIATISQPNLLVDRPDARQLRVTEGRIAFDHVRFHYGQEGGVLDDFDLTIEPGEKIGLVGPSGAGKSTVVNLLLRFYDLEGGRIVIDGQDIAGVTQNSLRAWIGVVTQDTSLLHRSVRDNIRYGSPDAGESAIMRAARAAKADQFIPELVDPHGRQGYDAHVGERGVKLSGGQRQRIAIARVMLKDAPILILDEATSALDSEVEAAIQDNLDRLMQGKTVIAIAHRLSTIAAMDRLVVMDNGRIIETGTHEALLRRGGLYARLWSRQSGGFIARGGEDRPPAAIAEPAA
ncbi:MAG TPA: ABC transporter ATP-binding protein [Afifellaceae bacterium]|nr:ABC transporter ATP-binding protein [Afifellaceae bacterium]